MKSLHLIFLFFLPMLITCARSSFGSYEFNNLSFVFRGMYMYQKEDSPHIKGNGISRINFNYTATTKDGASGEDMEMDVAILSEKAFNALGYEDNNKKVLCCDSKAVKLGLCKNSGHVLLPSNMDDEYTVTRVSLKNKENKGSLSFDVKRTGIYFIIAISCDYRVGDVHFDGIYETINPYGQLPAPQYGILPFTIWILVSYVVLMFIWLILCIKYAQDIMSVHIIILVVLISFIIDMTIKLIYLAVYNHTGSANIILAISSIVVDCSTRTLTRVMTLFVCMGLGVTKANLDDTLISCKLLLVGAAYYLITFADSYFNIYPSQNKTIEVARFISTALIDAIIYFWIFISLLDTMDYLKENKQEMKLSIFKKLRTLFALSVLVATGALVGFSYVIFKDLSTKIWKYQWFINDGIWQLFYLLMFICLMIMWRPSENTAAYAYHIQIATGEENEEYMPVDSLVDMEQSGDHVIIEGTSTEMKPMDVVELVQEQK